MAAVVYMLCFITALACAVLLLRGYRQSGAKLLLWSGLCFAMLTLNNLLLFVDLVLVPHIDLSLLRTLTALFGGMFMVYGLIWEAR